MKRLTQALIWAAILCAVGGAAWVSTALWPSQQQAATAQTTYDEVYTVARGDITERLSPIGEVYAPHRTSLAFAARDVRLVEVNVRAGQGVKAGDVLARIDTAPLQRDLDQARASLLSAEQALEDAQHPYTALDRSSREAAVVQALADLDAAKQKVQDLLDPDLDAARTEVEKAQSDLQVARDKLTALQADSSVQENIDYLQWQANELEVKHGTLAAKPNPNEEDRDAERVAYNEMMDAREAAESARLQAQLDLLSAQHEVSVCERALADARARLAERQGGPDPIDLALANNAVEQAEYNMQIAQQQLEELDAGPDPETVKLAQARYDSAKAAFDTAQAILDGATMTAPFDGTIVSVNGEVGDPVSPNTPVVTLADLSQLRVTASIDETEISKVEVGQAVGITLDAVPGARFTGRILEVPLQGSLVNNVVTYAVDISLEGEDISALKPGMTANLEIVIGSAGDVLVVPSMAITYSIDGALVEVQNADGSATTVPVQVGVNDGTYTEIVRGLNEGDRIVVTYQAQQEQELGFMGGGPPDGGAIRGVLVR